MNKTLKIACYGEVLWDVFPDKKRLGGAPLNVASRLHSFGAVVSMISAVGKDALGEETLAEIKSIGLDIANIQQPKLPTGSVKVSLDSKGSPTYEITENVAWDNIRLTKENEKIVAEADALVFGSLACREIHNQETLFQLIEKASYKVFDLNLRAPHYDLELVVALMEAAQCIKLNDEELELIVMALDIEGDSLEIELKALAKATGTESVCVTLGPEGAMLLHKGKIYTQVGFPAKVVDTVGAGDSFLAALTFGLLSGESPEDSLEVACVIGSLVASKAGANPEVSTEEIDKVLGL